MTNCGSGPGGPRAAGHSCAATPFEGGGAVASAASMIALTDAAGIGAPLALPAMRAASGLRLRRGGIFDGSGHDKPHRASRSLREKTVSVWATRPFAGAHFPPAGDVFNAHDDVSIW